MRHSDGAISRLVLKAIKKADSYDLEIVCQTLEKMAKNDDVLDELTIKIVELNIKEHYINRHFPEMEPGVETCKFYDYIDAQTMASHIITQAQVDLLSIYKRIKAIQESCQNDQLEEYVTRIYGKSPHRLPIINTGKKIDPVSDEESAIIFFYGNNYTQAIFELAGLNPNLKVFQKEVNECIKYYKQCRNCCKSILKGGNLRICKKASQ